jgi:hypothetical protein
VLRIRKQRILSRGTNTSPKAAQDQHGNGFARTPFKTPPPFPSTAQCCSQQYGRPLDFPLIIDVIQIRRYDERNGNFFLVNVASAQGTLWEALNHAFSLCGWLVTDCCMGGVSFLEATNYTTHIGAKQDQNQLDPSTGTVHRGTMSNKYFSQRKRGVQRRRSADTSTISHQSATLLLISIYVPMSLHLACFCNLGVPTILLLRGGTTATIFGVAQ